MLTPKNRKYRKARKHTNFRLIKPVAIGFSLKQNTTILKAQSPGRILSTTLFACKQTLTKILKKRGKLNIKILADIPITRKPEGIRMGKGKGSVDAWIAKVQTGTPIFEILSTTKGLGEKAFQIIQYKLPIPTRIIK